MGLSRRRRASRIPVPPADSKWAIVAIALAFIGVVAASTLGTASDVAISAEGRVTLGVEYAKTLTGIQGLYAVRSCAHDVASGVSPELVETTGSPPGDLALRLRDANGIEVAHFDGTVAVCDFAKFAASYSANHRARP